MKTFLKTIQSNEKLIFLLPLLIILGAFTSITILYLKHYPLIVEPLFDSDILYLPVLYKDLILQGGKYSDWYLTPAPYFFPDWVMYFLANFLTGKPYYAIATNFVMQLGLLAYLVYKINCELFEKPVAINLTALSIGLLCTLAVFEQEFALVLQSATHYGQFLISLLFVFFILKLTSQNNKYILASLLVSLLVLSFLVTISDKLFLVHCIVPLSVAMLLFIKAKCISPKQYLVIISLFTIGVLGALYSYDLIIPNSTTDIKNYEIGGKYNSFSLANFFERTEILFEHLLNGKLASIVKYSFAIPIAFLFIYIIQKHAKHKLAFLAIYTIVSGLIMMLVWGITSPRFAYWSRYFIPVYYLPVLFTSSFIYALFQIGKVKIKPLSISIFATIPFVIIFGKAISYPATIKNEYYPEYLKCIDENLATVNAKNGITTYWDHKLPLLLSKNNLNIDSVSETNLFTRKWITSKGFTKEKYDFAINVKKDILLKTSGPPTKTVQCGDKELHIYESNKLSKKILGMPSAEVTIQACKLGYDDEAKHLVVNEEACSLSIRKHTSKPQILSYSPYFLLEAGKYRFKLEYKSGATKQEIVANWGIISRLKKQRVIIDRGNILGGKNNLEVNFTITKGFENSKIAINTFYSNPNYDLELTRLTLSRIK